MHVFRVKESIHINAPLDRCFLLSTSIELVQEILGLNPVSGKTTGLITPGDQLLWRGWKFGLPALHETLITAYDRPNFFQDTMGRGRFRTFQHDHRFQSVDGHTLLVDVVRFSLPLGPLGTLAGKHILVPHVLALMQRRFALLKRIAEGQDWNRYLQPAASADAPSPRVFIESSPAGIASDAM